MRLSYVGESTPFDFVETMTAVFRAAGYRPGFGFLSDRLGAAAPATDYVGRTVTFAEAHREELAGARWATVVSSAENRGLARMTQGILDGSGDPVLALQVFTDIEEAERWLRETAPQP